MILYLYNVKLYTKMAQRRIMKDLKQIEKEPLNGIAINSYEDNLFLCDATFEIDCKNHGKTHMAILIHFSQEYPLKAPNVGFCVPFDYTQGASFIQKDGILQGKYIVCLNVLGNFAHVHDEWEGLKGEGWSPAYNLSSLLLIIQNLLNEEMSIHTDNKLKNIYDCCEEFKRNNTHLTYINTSVKDNESSPSIDIDIEDEELKKCIHFIQNKIGANIDEQNHFLHTIQFLIEKNKSKENETSFKTQEIIDPEIFCWYSNVNYTQDILGYGIKVKQQGRNEILCTDANYISKTAFFEDNLRVFPNKDTFRFFLPAFINIKHINTADWTNILTSSIFEIGSIYSLGHNFNNCVIKIFPDLINNLVVQMMDSHSDIRASELIFRCLLNLWRTFYHLISTNESLKNYILENVHQFIYNESKRNKEHTPNLGNILAMSTVLNETDINIGDFLNAFEFECSLRRVLWWQKDRVKLDANGTYQQCEISRNNVLFQILFRSYLLEIGILNRIEELDRFNCNVEGGVEVLLNKWKEILERTQAQPNWQQYYQELTFLGFPEEKKNKICSNVNNFIQNCIIKAEKLSGYTFTQNISSRKPLYIR